MTFLHFTPGTATIKKYSATTTGAKSVVRVEIEVNDHRHLAFLLDDIAEAQKKLREEQKPKATKPRQIEHRPMLALPHLRDEP